MGKEFDPDKYRMTIGEHLEELRRRMIYAVLGLGVVLIVCFCFGDRVLQFFCRPVHAVLLEQGLNPQLTFSSVSEPFTTWITVNIITAAAIASPWIVYQFWLFIAAGLYAHERKYVSRYAPLSVTLLITGMVFVYTFVLPWSIQFFLSFATSVPAPGTQIATSQPHTQLVLPLLHGDPTSPKEGELWIDAKLGQVKVFFQNGIRSIKFSTDNLLTPEIKLSDYIDLVVGMLLTFGLSFQLPFVVMALVRIGIMDVQAFKEARRYVYLIIAVLAATITPGDVIVATLALIVPLALLYELGILMAGWNKTAIEPGT